MFYDEPQIFTCISKSFQKYIALFIDSSDNQKQWLLSPISEARLTHAKQNEVEIRDLFTDPEADFIWKITLKDEFKIEQIETTQLTDDMLPCQGEFLDYEYEDDLLKSSSETAEEMALKEHRDVIEISLEPDNDHIHEVSCTLLSDMLDSTQELLYALANKSGGIKGQTPKTVKETCNLQVAGTFAASFGIRLKSDELCSINFETPLTPTLNELNKLLAVSNNKEELTEFLSAQNPRVALKYRKLIKTLINSNVGVKFSNASPNKVSFLRHFTTHELVANLSLIDSEIDKMVEAKTFYGKLVGINTKKHTFAFNTVDNEDIKGTLSEEIASDTFKVPQDSEILVEQSIDMNSFTREEKYAYKLLSLKPVVESKDNR